MASLILRPLLLLLAPVHFTGFPVHLLEFQASDSSAGALVLKNKMSQNHTRMTAVHREPEIRHQPMGRHFITGCLFTWEVPERKKRS